MKKLLIAFLVFSIGIYACTNAQTDDVPSEPSSSSSAGGGSVAVDWAVPGYPDSLYTFGGDAFDACGNDNCTLISTTTPYTILAFYFWSEGSSGLYCGTASAGNEVGFRPDPVE